MIMPELDFDLARMGWTCLLLVIAFVAAFPIAWDRESEERNLGLRTFPLVSVASCAFTLLALGMGDHSAEASDPALADARSRVLQGIITGVGFLGAGAIVKQGMTVQGTATAAAVWATSGIGIAVAFGYFEIAISLSLLGLATLRFLKPLKAAARGRGGEDARP
jgi:putative Mg2+ transporter-C (MgtC) family protein